MTNKANLLHALLERMQQQTAEVNKAMDDLQKAMEAVPSAERTGPEWDAFSAQFVELMKRQGELGKKLLSASQAIDDFDNIRSIES
jgi:hypothetical protein